MVDGKTEIVTLPPEGSVKAMVPPIMYCVGAPGAAESSGMNVKAIDPVLLSGSEATPSTTLNAPL